MNDANSPFLKVENLYFKYSCSDKYLFSKFSYDFFLGDIVKIQGRSGTGKTTLLFIICGVIPRHIKGDISGTILLKNKNIDDYRLPELATQISILFQEPESFFIFPETVQELTFGMENQNIPSKKIKEKLILVTKLLKIEKLLTQPLRKLSYGQKKMIAYAGLLMHNPVIYLLDEPFEGLSAEYQKIILESFDWLLSNNKIVIVSDHSGRELSKKSKSIVL